MRDVHLLFIYRMRGPYCEVLIPKFGSTDRACVKTEGLVFHGTGRAIWLIDSFLYGKNENILKIHREFVDYFPKNFSQNMSKIIFSRFSGDFHNFRQLSEDSLRLS